MTNTQDNNFYLQHIPQSEYRRILSKETPERQVMDIGLHHLGITDPIQKKQLVEKIKAETEQFLRVLVSEPACEVILDSAYLNTILASLGLL